ncbi:SagB/ThcOx family dehydrogenase [Haladaptatus sp. NG-SE-30]
MSHGVGADEYHERTKHSPRSVRGGGQLDWENKPTPYKTYTDLPRVDLEHTVRPPQMPTLTALRWAVSDEAGLVTLPIDREILTQLCYYSAGITRELPIPGRSPLRRDKALYRAASCTGKLYHIDLYPVVGGDVGGLDAGVYHFDPRTLSLDILREGDFRGVLAEASGDEPHVTDAPVTIVATSTWWRNAWKYGDRTYRHAFWDSGTVLSNLTTVSHALELPTTVVTGFADEQVATLLGLDTAEEAPLELVPIGTGASAPESSSVSAIDPATEPLSDHVVDHPLIHEAYVGSSLPDGGAVEDWRNHEAEESLTRPAGDGERVSLAPVGPERASKVPLHETITRRGSCREFVRDELNFRKVSTILDQAVSGVQLDVRSDDGPALQYTDCYLLVNGIDGVESGAYHYHPDAGELEQLRTGSCRKEAGHLALDQRLGADAAVCAYFLADVDAITDRFGNRGYRVAQLEAALTAGKLYLGTYAHRDLGGTGLTFYDDLVTEFLSPRAAGQTPMFLYTLGRPA